MDTTKSHDIFKILLFLIVVRSSLIFLLDSKKLGTNVLELQFVIAGSRFSD